MIIVPPSGQIIILKWVGQVGQWDITMPKRTNPTGANDAALLWYFEHIIMPQKTDPHARHRCIRGYPWVCPYLKAGGATPCISPSKRDNIHLVTIDYTDYERHPRSHPKKDAHGQLMMFETEHYFLNLKTGKKQICEPNDPRPYHAADLVCKEFGVASMEWLKHKQGWSALKWRILPLNKDTQWLNEQQIKYSGKYKSCLFDIWD